MDHDHKNPEEIRDKFWKKLADSPFVMLEIDGDHNSAAPMTAQRWRWRGRWLC